MKHLKELKKTCDEGITMALATSVDNVPNVRIVNYVWDENRPNILYFTTDLKNDKIKEFEINNHVAIYTIPIDLDGGTSLRSNNATVRKSSKALKDVKELFIEKMPSYAEALELMRDTLIVFEVVLNNGLVTIGYDNFVFIDFSD